MCAYEIGFSGSDTFLFCPRKSTTMEAAVLDASNICAIVSQELGFDRAYNEVTVTFGDYGMTVDSVRRMKRHPRQRTCTTPKN